nr:polyprenyl synthetase family protein [Granulicoccus phenolivorans]
MPHSEAVRADAVGDPAFTEQVRSLLGVIEERLLATATADTPMVTEAAQHIISAGGKRFRPLLVILSAQFGEEPDRDDLVRAALVMELTHVASLYHDDVMDDADTRRGAPAANRRWQNSVAIMVGDFLFARASSTVAELGTEFVSLQAKTFARLVQGQIAETVGPSEDADPLGHYLQVLEDKTGSLIEASAMFGAMVSRAPAETVEALRRFGAEIGMVFQLSDDLIDITSDATGKTPGTDLREGVWTLPTLLVRASVDPADDELKALIAAAPHEEAAHAEALRRLRLHPAIARARAEVERRAAIAREILSPLPQGPAKSALLELCDQVVTRSQ